MKTKIYSVYDKKAQAFCTPFYQANHATAVRAFQNAVLDPQNSISQNPEDYVLFHVGDWDDNIGEIQPQMESICGGLEARAASAKE